MTASSIGRGTESLARVFVDTSAFYALEDASDRHHREARLIQRWCLRQRPRLFTTDHVIDESITLIGAHLRPGSGPCASRACSWPAASSMSSAHMTAGFEWNQRKAASFEEALTVFADRWRESSTTRIGR